jgi:hypothetical protein
VAEHPRLERIRGWASAALFAVYLLAFVALGQGVTAYLTRWFGPQMVLGVLAVWLFPLHRARGVAVRRASPQASPQ